MSLSREYWQALQVSLIFQVFFGLFSAMVQHGGPVLLRIWAAAMLAYWFGFGLVAIRRPYKPARLDLFLIRWSFPVLFFPVTPVVMTAIWMLRGAKY